MTRRQPWDLFTVFPAHAGVILRYLMPHLQRYSIPRTRGGDPIINGNHIRTKWYSPHTRGRAPWEYNCSGES